MPNRSAPAKHESLWIWKSECSRSHLLSRGGGCVKGCRLFTHIICLSVQYVKALVSGPGPRLRRRFRDRAARAVFRFIQFRSACVVTGNRRAESLRSLMRTAHERKREGIHERRAQPAGPPHQEAIQAGSCPRSAAAGDGVRNWLSARLPRRRCSVAPPFYRNIAVRRYSLGREGHQRLRRME